MTTAPLPPGTHLIYFGNVRSEFAESYSVQGVCDCAQCTSKMQDRVRYRLRGEHVRWAPSSGSYERVGGTDLVHVDASHVVPSPEGPEPWQINMEILREMGIPMPD
ncbi:hypothetical protein [Streptomyces sp. NPDC020298]|uniref:hypothetical protein n=1 Tax=unclassified Streptomyces TaxID=2593676 RepID=UPI0033DF03AC